MTNLQQNFFMAQVIAKHIGAGLMRRAGAGAGANEPFFGAKTDDGIAIVIWEKKDQHIAKQMFDGEFLTAHREYFYKRVKK